jgi:peptide deformylase
VATLEIRTFGDPVLRQRAQPVERVTETHDRLIEDMIETMRVAPGVGLAAPQIGVLERIFVWEVEDEHGAFINPEITWRSDSQGSGEEGCLSIPGLYYPVVRAEAVEVRGLDASGQAITMKAEGFLARVCQHEIDHLDGVLFLDRLEEDIRREALAMLREQMLGLAPAPAGPPQETL